MGVAARAALDVFEIEPLPGYSPLLLAENRVVPPHCSLVYAGWEDESFSLFHENPARWIKGQELASIVDPRMRH